MVIRRPTALLLLLNVAVLGCGETQVSPANRRIVESLATAVSARNADWLRENAELIAARKAAGKLEDAEARALQEIVDLAAAGRWPAAEERAFALRDGQRGGAEDAAEATSARPKLRPPNRDHRPRLKTPRS